jgi:phage gp36-like protein
MYSTLTELKKLIPEEILLQAVNDENTPIVSDLWQASHAYIVGDQVLAEAGGEYYYEVTAKSGTGTSGATVPVWPTTIGETVIDNPGENQLTWTCMSTRIPAVVTTRIDEAIAQADAEIDTYCATRYTVPFTTVPEAIKKCSVDIAIYNLYSRYVNKMPEARADRYKNCILLLKAIAKGTISIGETPEPTANESTVAAESNKTSRDRVFTRTKMRGF